MSFERPTRLQFAVHEAGHAYALAALVEHEMPEEMGLGRDDKGDHHGWSRRRSVLDLEVPFRNLPPVFWPTFEWQADVEIAVKIAGPLAEFRQHRRSRFAALFLAIDNVDVFLRQNAFDTDGDFDSIRRLLAHMGEPLPSARVREMICVADMVLAEKRPSIQRLARLLMGRGRLDEAALLSWFTSHPARPHLHDGWRSAGEQESAS